jgi:DNA-binding NarL/FixJ family response regulator
MAIRVLLADDHPVVRYGLTAMLDAVEDIDVVASVPDGPSALREAQLCTPDVAILDIRMPPAFSDEGLKAAHALRDSAPQVGVLILSQYVDSDYAFEILSGDARGRGYLLKDRVMDVESFTDAVRRIGEGGSVVDPEVVDALLRRAREPSPLEALTERERDVLSLMAEGRSNQAIGDGLHLSPKTVEAHVTAIFSKLGLAPAADDHRRVLAVLTYLRG